MAYLLYRLLYIPSVILIIFLTKFKFCKKIQSVYINNLLKDGFFTKSFLVDAFNCLKVSLDKVEGRHDL